MSAVTWTPVPEALLALVFVGFAYVAALEQAPFAAGIAVGGCVVACVLVVGQVRVLGRAGR